MRRFSFRSILVLTTTVVVLVGMSVFMQTTKPTLISRLDAYQLEYESTGDRLLRLRFQQHKHLKAIRGYSVSAHTTEFQNIQFVQDDDTSWRGLDSEIVVFRSCQFQQPLMFPAGRSVCSIIASGTRFTQLGRDETLPQLVSANFDQCENISLLLKHVPVASLRRITLESMELTTADWEQVARFTSLQKLTLNHCRMSQYPPQNFQWPASITVEINQTQLSPEWLVVLRPLATPDAPAATSDSH